MTRGGVLVEYSQATPCVEDGIYKKRKLVDFFSAFQTFNRPTLVYRNYSSGASPIDGLMRALYLTPMQSMDRHMTKQVFMMSLKIIILSSFILWIKT